MPKTKTSKMRLVYRFRADYDYGSSANGASSGLLAQDLRSAALDSTVTFGDNLPNWKLIIERQQNATTSLSGSVYRVLSAKEGVGEWMQKYVPDTPGTAYESRHVTAFGYPAMPASLIPSFSIPSSSTTADNRALARFNAKAASVNRQFQGGVFLAELHKTLHGIRHPAEALFKGIEKYSIAATKLRRSIVKDKAAYQALSKSARKQASKAFTKAATGLWLENSFHWLPLMYDIQGAVSALTALYDSNASTFIKVSAFDEQQRSQQEGQVLAGPMNIRSSTVQTAGAAVRMYGRVRVGPRDPYVPDMKAIGLDVRSFVPTLWELIPYSWAVDYFTNIGDMIYGGSYGGCDVLWASRGSKRFAKLQYKASAFDAHVPAPAGWHYVVYFGVFKPSEVVIESAVISRAVYGGTFVPSFEWRIPGLSLKWLNLGAAFLQRSLAFL
jgi:hypothetical protein